MTPRIIETPAHLAEGAAWLAARDPRLARALADAGPLPLRRKPDGFAALLDAIVGQQVSTASASAILARMQAMGLIDEARLAAASDEDLRAAGLSRQKMRYLRALAEARLDYPGLRSAPSDEVIARLSALPGIGAWTAEIYAMFALGHADVFAPGDLALQEAVKLIYDLPARPGEKALRQMSAAWSPWRGVAARLFWTYYRQVKGREGVR
jgi:DNA-3-methyladenine glycosylase II